MEPHSNSSQSPERRLPSLDGVRALAIALVCISHLADTHSAALRASVAKSLAVGHLGVTIFFVLSGFLITSLLLRELTGSGTISLRRFYLRRTLRIFPAYYAFLALIVLATTCTWERFDYGNGLAALTYTSDYFFPGPNTLDHSWSLAIEEQFYLMWPAILLFCGARRARRVVLGAALLSPLSRVADAVLRMHFGIALPIAPADYRFDTQSDALAIGCLMALSRDWLHQHETYLRVLRGPLMILVPLVILLLEEYDLHPVFHSQWVIYAYLLLGFSVMNLGIAFCIDSVLTHPQRLAGRVLNWKPVAFVGVLSYSLYIWQQIFLIPARPAWFTVFPINLILAFAAACTSYFVIERPFLRLRSRLDRHLFAPRSVPVSEIPAAVATETA